MRVTEGSMTDKYLYNQQKILIRKAKIQTQLAMNSKIETLSDDLIGSLQSIKVQSQIKKTENYLQNTDTVSEFMKASLQQLDSINVEIQKVMIIASDAVNPLNVQNYATMAQSVKDSLSAIVQSVNTKHNDMYLFSGTNFQERPVAIDPATGKAIVSTADFSGEVNTQISQNATQTMNIPGSKVLSTGIFESLNSIIDSLTAGVAPTQTENDNLNSAFKDLLNLQSLGGQTVNRMDDINQMLSNQKDSLDGTFAKIQEVDVPALAIDLQNQDYLLQVAYKLLANSFPKSLFDYL